MSECLIVSYLVLRGGGGSWLDAGALGVRFGAVSVRVYLKCISYLLVGPD